MSRAGIIPLVAAALALSCPARADDGVRRNPFVELKVQGGGGASFTTSQRAISVDLVRSGWPALPAITPAFELGFGLAFQGFSIDLHLHGSDVSFQDRAGSPIGMEYHRGILGAELGYRFWIGRSLSLSPHVGIASLTSTLCFAGHPDPTSAPSRPPFEQVLANPGRKTCLDASATGIDVGLTPAWNFHFPFYKGERDPMGLYLSVGPRVSYALPFSRTRTWGEKNPTDHRPALPSFEGPLAPLGEAYVGIEIQVRFAVETMDTSPRAGKGR